MIILTITNNYVFERKEKGKVKKRESKVGIYLYAIAFVPGSCDSLREDDLKQVVFFYGHNQ